MDDDQGSRKPMDPNLKDAACNGNTKFLKNAIARSKPQDYWLSRFIPTTNSKEPYAGNILHLAVWHGKTDFLKTAMEKLPEEVVSQLLRHRERARELHNWTPALLAIQINDDCSIAEMLTSGSRAKLIQDLVDDQDNSPLFLAVQKGFDNVVMNILDCRGPLCARGPNGLTALHVVPGLLHYKSASWYDFGGRYDKRWREVSAKLFERLRELTTATDTNGFTILHKWVETYSLSDSSTKNRIARIFADFFQRFQGDAVKLMLATDHKDCNNVLHHTAIFASTDTVAKQLIESYKNCTSKPSDLLQPWLMKNKDGDTPLILAIRNKRDKLAVLFLSADPAGSLRLSDRQNPFIFAVCNQCNEVAKEILARVAEHDLMSLLPFDDNPRPDVLRFALRFPGDYLIPFTQLPLTKGLKLSRCI